MTKPKSIRLGDYDKAFMRLLLHYPAIASEHVLSIMKNLGYERSIKYNSSRLRQLCGARDNPSDKKYSHRKINKTGLYLTYNPYYMVSYGAEHGETTSGRVGLYSLTTLGARAIGYDKEALPQRSTRYGWAYYHQSGFLEQALSSGIPLSDISTAIDYKRSRYYGERMPMWILLSFPHGRYLINFTVSGYTGLDTAYSWNSALSFASNPNVRSESYVIITPRSRFVALLKSLLLRGSVYRTHLVPYDDSTIVFSDLRKSPDYYLDLLVSHLGVDDFGPSYGSYHFPHSGRYYGNRIYLCEFVSGNMRTFCNLVQHSESLNVPVYCLVREWQLPILSEFAPPTPIYNYVVYEHMRE